MEQEQTTIQGVETAQKEKKARKKYPRLTSIEEIPESRSQITFEWIIAYIAENGTPEQCEKLLKCIESNPVERKCNLKYAKKESYEVPDIIKVRNLFCEMFFPELRERKTPPKRENQVDLAKRMLAEKASQAKKLQSAKKREGAKNNEYARGNPDNASSES